MEKFKTTSSLYDSYSELGKAFLIADRKGRRTGLVLLTILLLVSLAANSWQGIFSFAFLLLVHMFFYVVPSWYTQRITNLTGRAKANARSYLWTVPKRKEYEYSFTTSFGEKELIIRDVLEYSNNAILKIPYDTITHCIETKRFFVIVSKRSYGLCWLLFFGWVLTFYSLSVDSYFGMVDKAEIEKSGEREELIKFLAYKCEKIKFELKS